MESSTGARCKSRKIGGCEIVPDEQVSVDVNAVVEQLLAVISGQALTIAKLEALNKKLMEELQGRGKRE